MNAASRSAAPVDDYAVVIPAYNAASTLRCALDSVLAQTLPPREVMVVDDGSPDREAIAAVIAGYGGRVRLLQKANGGPASARNAGARATSCDWIAFLDADDSWLPDKMARQMELGRDGHAGLLHGCARAGLPTLPRQIDFQTLWRRNRVCTSMSVVRRSVFEALGGFEEDPALIGAEDYNLWLRIAHAGWRVLACPELIGHYTPAEGSVTSGIERCARAEIHNAEKLGRQLGLSPAQVRRKVSAIRTDFGRHLLHARQLGVARRMLMPALRHQPTLERLSLWSATFVPKPLLDLRRRLRERRRR